MAANGKMLKSIKVKRRKNAPAPLLRGTSAADTDSGKCYFMSKESHEVRMYDMEADDWSVLRKCPNCDPTLVVLDGMLTAVGGRKLDEDYCWQYTNKLLSYSNRRWIEKFPEMPVDPALGINGKVMRPGATKHERTLLVTGCHDHYEEAEKSSRMLDMESGEWRELCALPDRLYCPTAVVCGDEVFAMGGTVWRRVFQCFLEDLTDSSKSTGDVWNSIADMPYVEATCTSLCGQLVAIGGRGEDSLMNTVNAYDPNKDSWYTIGKLALPRAQPHVLRLSEDTILVVGGRGSGSWADYESGGSSVLAELITGVTA